MTITAWILIGLEVAAAIGVILLIWKTKRERPTETIVPATDEDVELVE